MRRHIGPSRGVTLSSTPAAAIAESKSSIGSTLIGITVCELTK